MAINNLKGNNVHYELINMNTSTSLLLQSPALSANMTLEDVAGLYENMRKETILKQYCDTSKIKERKQLLYELCNENSADEIFVLFMKALDIDVQSNRYQTYYVMMRHYLQALIEDKLIEGEFNGERYVYRKK